MGCTTNILLGALHDRLQNVEGIHCRLALANGKRRTKNEEQSKPALAII